MTNGFGNYGGTVYYKNIPLFNFKYSDDMLWDLDIITPEYNYKCFFFKEKGVTTETLDLFLRNRLTPETRHNLRKRYLEAGMPYYNPEWLLRYSKGRTCDDEFWINPDSNTRGLAGIDPKYWHNFVRQ